MTHGRCLIIGAAWLTLIVVLALTGIDILIIEEINKIYEPFRYAMTYVTEFGKSEYYLVPALIGALFFWWRARASVLICERVRQYWRASVCLYLFACVALSGIAGNIIKLIVGRSRPKEWLESGIYSTDPFTLVSRWHSFPSGHANTMVAVVIALVPFIDARWRPALVGIAAVIIASRCLVAAHYISDVLGGAGLAAIVCYYIERYTRAHYRLPFAPIKG